MAATLTLPAVLMATPADAASAAQRSGTLAEQAASLAPEEGAQPVSALSGHMLCATEPAGDTVRWENGQYVPERHAPADIVRVCAEYDQDEIVVRVRLDEPTDPRTDPRWRGANGAATGALWFVDLGDGFRHVISYEWADGSLVADVHTVPEDDEQEDPELVCRGVPQYAGETLIASGFDPQECFGTPDRIAVQAVMVFDSDPADPQAPIYIDFGEHLLGVGRSGAPTLRPTSRLGGATRIHTAAVIAENEFLESAPVVYLARQDDFPDALAAGALKALEHNAGPILLVPSCGALPEPVAEQVARLDPVRVVALGGTNAVCEQLLAEAAAVGAGGRAAQRLAGPDRYATSVAISRRAYPDMAGTVYLATGERFPDALAAGSLDDGPVLLVPSCESLPDPVRDELERLDPDRVVALGGGAAVCGDVLAEAAAAGRTGSARETARLAGPTRLDTAVQIARERFPDGAERVFLARADTFPDALAAGALRGGPVLLVPSCGDIPPVVASAIRALDLDPGADDRAEVVALGGESAVCAQMLRHAGNA